MYLKLSLADELFIIKNFTITGVETNLPDNFLVKLYNKIGSNYIQITELSETGNVSRELLTDPTAVYASIYIDNKLTKSYVKVNVVQSEVVSTYSITYSSNYGLSPTSTTFLKRYTLSMPAWSSAFKNDVSVYSKLIHPLFLITERIYYKTNEYLWNNLRSESNNTRRNSFSSPILSIQRDSDNKYISKSLIKQKEAINNVFLEELNIKNIKLINTNHLESLDFPIILGNNFNNLLLKTSEETVITVVGLNQYGESVTESIYVNDVSLVTGLSKYKKIISVTPITKDIIVEIFNYADCLENNTIRYPYEIAGTVTKIKTIDVPSYIYNEETECLNSYHKENLIQTGDLEDSYKIPEMAGFSKFFVTNQEDLVVLKDSKLYTGLLRKTIETPMPIYPSNNNNSLVSVLTEDAHLDNVVEFQINTKDIIEDYGNVSVQIRIISNTGTLYLNSNNDWVEEVSYKFLDNINPIYIELNVSQLTYISVELEFNSVVYQASIRKDIIPLTDTGLEIDDLIHNGEELIAKIGTKYSKVILEKDYYEVVGKNKVAYSKYDPTKYTVKNIKGNKYA